MAGGDIAQPPRGQVGGFPIGLTRQPDCKEGTAELCPGDRLYLYADGLLEAENKDGCELGAEQLGEEIQGSRDLGLHDSVEALGTLARRWAGGELHDDLSILALEIAGGPEALGSPG